MLIHYTSKIKQCYTTMNAARRPHKQDSTANGNTRSRDAALLAVVEALGLAAAPLVLLAVGVAAPRPLLMYPPRPVEELANTVDSWTVEVASTTMAVPLGIAEMVWPSYVTVWPCLRVAVDDESWSTMESPVCMAVNATSETVTTASTVGVVSWIVEVESTTIAVPLGIADIVCPS